PTRRCTTPGCACRTRSRSCGARVGRVRTWPCSPSSSRRPSAASSGDFRPRGRTRVPPRIGGRERARAPPMTAARHTVASAAGFPQSRDAPRIAIVAGEASGDLLGAGLMRELRRHLPQARFEGVSGPRMRAEGCATLYDVDDLSLIGFEGAARIPRVLAARRRLAAYFRARPPALYIGVDAPDFNLGLEKRLRAAGITTVHYVSPTVWAWREYRMRTIHRAVDH